MTDVRTEAVAIAHGYLRSRVEWKLRGLVDAEELRQDLAVHVLASLKYYRPERGSLKTFVGMTFDQWWRQSIKDRATRKALESPTDEFPDLPVPAAEETELSERGREIIARLPEHTREVAELVIAHGVPMKAAAELTGTKYQTVNTRVQRARRALKEMA
jgi:RNA polymerase sigma factor (sigma-70 family)